MLVLLGVMVAMAVVFVDRSGITVNLIQRWLSGVATSVQA